ncbi:Aste57867_19892 [Aphanomyces stellatus]|uniref:Aste57867_19892 protein n=1 Tax=Aphanomyces stellatus TaxID=120398 RepID=A0A485LEV5_9STRA|nr:hypothetical protein As57867_019826 [Aphanomyces stellatus]VFT96590.1 Aste57867_19892 [Aphanomyces stellatus]
MSASSICSITTCTQIALPGKFKCLKHKKKSQCTVAHCPNLCNKRGVCVGHGARRGGCRVVGCRSTQRRVGHFCYLHGKQQPSSTPHSNHGPVGPKLQSHMMTVVQPTTTPLGFICQDTAQCNDLQHQMMDSPMLDDEWIVECLAALDHPAASSA